MPERLLLGPGPSNVSDEVRNALARPVVGHLDPAFLALLDDVQRQLLQVFRAPEGALALPISGTGSAGMEACLVNLYRANARMGLHQDMDESAPDAGRQALADLLTLVFRYDARGILQTPEAHAVLARTGARAVIRELANLVLDGPEVGSDRFREIVEKLRKRTGASGREIFQPLRLALAGRAGGGEFDRVILLLDPAARLPFRARVKGTRERMLEFCSALD